MQTISFGECVAGAWRDAWNMALQRPLFIAVCTTAIFFTRFIQVSLGDLPAPHSLQVMLVIGMLWLVKLLLTNAVIVQAMRYVVLGDEAIAIDALGGRDYWRYLGLTYGLMVVMIVAVVGGTMLVATASRFLGIHGHARALYMTSACAMAMAAIWVNVRLCLLSSHVAIGRPLSWRAAWRDTHGHAMIIIGTWLTIALTICVAAVLLMGIAALISYAVRDGRHGPVIQFAQILVLVAAVSISGAGSGWIYRRYAMGLITPPRGL
ncbi:hypothetical protein LMG28688_01720 [Paraburkholderia caffeinitolerans]|uniref:Uncharacterized protein n=1 Tax=Paraburkholderia caffeinitolerans TaxID=1723730 RepID=A0A6J5FSA4_9BURK|nr:hypothetical protein [Paraburkholderia caffeinitolerans]CAB3783794.1 hypothetical protein LMG28688_01720 [Paraburkholderia caffeinitolerans]